MKGVLIFLLLVFAGASAREVCSNDFSMVKIGDKTMRIKAGVKLAGISTEMMIAAFIADEIYSRYGVELVITGGKDGKHKPGAHYNGNALDFRTRDFKDQAMIDAVVHDLQKALWDNTDVEKYGIKLADNNSQQSEYLVIFEGDHIHCQFKPAS